MSKKSFKLLLIGVICLVLLGNLLIFIDSDDSQILFYSNKTLDEALPVTRSSIENYGGVPTLFINGEPQPALAYMTYFQENNEYESFTLAGYELFSLPVFFSTRGINTLSNISPFEQGIFEIKGEPNFEIFDQNIETILEQNSNAYILPRMNISMPTWWEEENPTEVNITEDGESKRESFYSEKWRKDAGELVLQFIKHINQSDYRDRILGYQIACGNTEEWFHFDLNGGIGPAAERGFEAFIKQMYPDEVGDYDGLPKFKSDNEVITDDLHHWRFLEFCSLAVADAISYFSGLVKEATNYQLIVGTFYGYGLEVYTSDYDDYLRNIKIHKMDNAVLNVKHTKNTFEFDTNYENDEFVVLNIPIDKGWTLKNGTEEVTKYKVNGGFIGFVAKGGLQHYKLTYVTPSLMLGIGVTAGSSFIFFILTFSSFYVVEIKEKKIKIRKRETK